MLALRWGVFVIVDVGDMQELSDQISLLEDEINNAVEAEDYEKVQCFIPFVAL